MPLDKRCVVSLHLSPTQEWALTKCQINLIARFAPPTLAPFISILSVFCLALRMYFHHIYLLILWRVNATSWRKEWRDIHILVVHALLFLVSMVVAIWSRVEHLCGKGKVGTLLVSGCHKTFGNPLGLIKIVELELILLKCLGLFSRFTLRSPWMQLYGR